MSDLAGEALFRPVRAGNAFEETVGRLLQTVRLGIVAPGDALPPERDLAARFSVSRDTVREAIRSLSDAGFLVSRRGRYGGTFVVDVLPARGVIEGIAPTAPPTLAELDDALALRGILETGAARAAAARSLSAPGFTEKQGQYL
ncbi:MAG: GntR family transcriptional regulator, partial [Actinomycetota bacterium]